MALYGTAKCPQVKMTVFVLGEARPQCCDLDVDVNLEDGVYSCECSENHIHYPSQAWVDAYVVPV